MTLNNDRKSWIEKIREWPLWVHAIVLLILFGMYRSLHLFALGGLMVGLVLLLPLVGPAWFLPIPAQWPLWAHIAIMLPALCIYYLPLFLIRRKVECKPGLWLYTTPWKTAFKIYLTINLLCVAGAILWTVWGTP